MDQFNSNDGDDWMATYADAITLLMAFFVLLYSMSTIDAKKYEVFRQSVMEHLGQRSELADDEGVPDERETDAASSTAPEPAGESRARERDRALAASLQKTLVAMIASGGEVQVTRAGIMLEFPGDVVYESGSADLRDDARGALSQAVQSILHGSMERMMVTIEGHSDNQSITTAQFNSNWDLAAVRASRIADFLVSSGVERGRVRSISYGDTRPKVSNETPEGRAKNRRVTILFERPESATWGPADGLNWGDPARRSEW